MLISKFDTQNVKESIIEFENKHDFKFPNQYRAFLEKYNGGETPRTDFKLNKISSDIRGLFGFGNINKYYSYNHLEEFDILKEAIKDGVLPIGENVFGDYIMLGIDDGHEGKIYFHYHDRRKKYIELAKDFKTFVAKCKSKKIGHIRTIEERKAYVISVGNGDKIDSQLIKSWQVEIDRYKNIHQEELIL